MMTSLSFGFLKGPCRRKVGAIRLETLRKPFGYLLEPFGTTGVQRAGNRLAARFLSGSINSGTLEPELDAALLPG
jgi:hypothetical protein